MNGVAVCRTTDTSSSGGTPRGQVSSEESRGPEIESFAGGEVVRDGRWLNDYCSNPELIQDLVD